MLLYAAVMAPSQSVNSTQRRVDKLVQGCDAAKVVHLKAESPKQVVTTMLIVGRTTTRTEDQRFTCVLNGLQKMKDLRFGFVGNEAEPQAQP